MGKNGGTNMYCPYCKKIQPCAVATFVKTNSNHQQRQSTKHPDIHWFERGRFCPECLKGFTTVEINEKLLHELIKLRDLRTTLKDVAENCFDESNQLTSDLKKMLELLETK